MALTYSNRRRPPPPFFQSKEPPAPTSNFDAWALDRLLGLEDAATLIQPQRTLHSLMKSPPDGLTPNITNKNDLTAAGGMAPTLAIPVYDVHSKQWVTQLPIGGYWNIVPPPTNPENDVAVYLDNIKLRIKATSLYLASTTGAVTSNERVGFRVLVVEVDHQKSYDKRIADMAYGAADAIYLNGPTVQDFLMEPPVSEPQLDISTDIATRVNGLSERAFYSPLRPKFNGDESENIQFSTAVLPNSTIQDVAGRYGNSLANPQIPAVTPYPTFFTDLYGSAITANRCPYDRVHVPSPFYYRVLYDQPVWLSQPSVQKITNVNVPSIVEAFTNTAGVLTGSTSTATVGTEFVPVPKPGCNVEILIPVKKWFEWSAIPSATGSTVGTNLVGSHSIYLFLIPNQSNWSRQASDGESITTFHTFSGAASNQPPIPTPHVTVCTVESCYTRDSSHIVVGEEHKAAMPAVDAVRSNDAVIKRKGAAPYSETTGKRPKNDFFRAN